MILLRSNKLYKIITNPNEPPVEMKSKNGGVKRELHHLLQDQNIEYLEEFYRLQTKISKNKKWINKQYIKLNYWIYFYFLILYVKNKYINIY